MEEFEETWSKDVVGHDDTNPAHVVNKATAKRYWMLALEWITNDVCPEAWDVGDVEFDIQQEFLGK